VCWSIQGRVADIALIAGTALENDPGSQIAYQFYCYLNLVHVLVHKGANKGLEFSMADIEQSGLIRTKQETKILADMEEYECSQVNAVIAWIGTLFKMCVKNGNINHEYYQEFNRNLGRLRAGAGIAAHMSGDEPPLSWAVTMVSYALIKYLAQLPNSCNAFSLMQVIILETQCVLFILGFAGDTPRCEHYFTIPFVNTVVMCVAFGFALRLCEALDDPWGTDKDDLNVTALLFDAERHTYNFLKRGNYPDIKFNTERITTPKKLIISNISAINLTKKPTKKQNKSKFMCLSDVGKIDPYCKVMANGVEIGRTSIATNQLSPKWKGTFEITIYDLRCSSVSLEVYDSDDWSSDDFLGNSTIGPDVLAAMNMESGSGNQEKLHRMAIQTSSPRKAELMFSTTFLQ
jgi:hypothetical protein